MIVTLVCITYIFIGWASENPPSSLKLLWFEKEDVEPIVWAKLKLKKLNSSRVRYFNLDHALGIISNEVTHPQRN